MVLRAARPSEEERESMATSTATPAAAPGAVPAGAGATAPTAEAELLFNSQFSPGQAFNFGGGPIPVTAKGAKAGLEADVKAVTASVKPERKDQQVSDAISKTLSDLGKLLGDLGKEISGIGDAL